jgi:hypothetical protein
MATSADPFGRIGRGGPFASTSLSVLLTKSIFPVSSGKVVRVVVGIRGPFGVFGGKIAVPAPTASTGVGTVIVSTKMIGIGLTRDSTLGVSDLSIHKEEEQE